MLKRKVFGLTIFLAITPLILLGQEYKAGSSTGGPSAGQTTPVQQDDRPVLEQRNPRYHVQRDDVLNISFPLSPELNQTVTIQPDGYVVLQNIGSLYVQGMTLPDLTDALTKAYGKVLNNPIINVDLKDFQKPFFVVTGQVAKPGQYDLRYDTTVSEAIAIGGGLLPTAKTQLLIYHRVSPGWMQVSKYNLKDFLNGKNVNEDAMVKPGDMIFIPEKTITNFRKYVPYTVGLYATPAPAWF
jgi:polysaccharide biosynthesis/export protein